MLISNILQLYLSMDARTLRAYQDEHSRRWEDLVASNPTRVVNALRLGKQHSQNAIGDMHMVR